MEVLCAKNGHLFKTLEFDSRDQAKIFIDRILADREPKVIDDNEIAIGTLHIKSQDLRDIMLCEPDWAITLPTSYEPIIKELTGRRKATDEEKTKRKKAKAQRGDYTTISSIAKELGKTPRDCRGALRALKVPKPPHGWSWPPSDAKMVKQKLIKRFRKVSPPSLLQTH